MDIATVESLLRVGAIIYENEFPTNDNHNLRERMFTDAKASKQEKKLPSTISPLHFYLVPSEKKGQGLACTQDITEGQHILQYVGVYTHDDLVTNEDSWYCFHTGKKGWRIEAKERGGLCRFVNHSCRPNCILKSLWYENRVYCFLEAMENIPKDTELTYHYNFTLGSGAKNPVCHCGSKKHCSGYIGKRMQNEENSAYVCKTCKKRCDSRKKLEEHQRVHTGEHPFACDECSNSFTTNTNLKRHIRSIHLKQKNFNCYKCSKKFTTKHNLNYHLKIIHRK